MVSGAYDPRWVTVRIESAERPTRALCFLMNRAHARYAGRLDEQTVARAIACAKGPLGACRDYLDRTMAALTELGLRDRPLERVHGLVRKHVTSVLTPKAG
jgi:cation transport protein ChaC